MLITKQTYGLKDQRTIDKYLQNYAEPESLQTLSLVDNLTAPLLPGSWDHVVTIPACGEDAFLPGALGSISTSLAGASKQKVLCLIVLNGNEAREAEFSESNARMRRWFIEHCQVLARLEQSDSRCPQTLLRWKNIDILSVDRSAEPCLIPADQGVGLVRKIAADCALRLIAAGKINSVWVHATDADARVPEDYFLKVQNAIDKIKSPSAVSCFIYPYQHIPDPQMGHDESQRYWSALTDYELWLRYYVAGLKWAGSSYAYPSIGSLLACDALAYARIRGFPKRMAGEDFYFQNKLAKVGRMLMLQGPPIKLLTRASTRVPFGTGQGTIEIDKLNCSGLDYMVYHPQVFTFLKNFHHAVKAWFDAKELDEQQRRSQFYRLLEQADIPVKMVVAEYKLWLRSLLDELDIVKNLQAAEKRSKSIPGACNQFNDWFDGFKTLKLIHRLRDDLYGNLPLIEALQQSVFLQQPKQKLSHEKLKAVWLKSFHTSDL